MAGVRASATVDNNIAKDRAASAAQNFQSAGTCPPAACTNGRPVRPDNRSAGTGVARQNEPCCTSWWPGTRRRRSVIAVVTDPALANTLLTALELPSDPVTFAPARSPPQAELPWDEAS